MNLRNIASKYDEDDDTDLRRYKHKSSSFWTATHIFMGFLFILGLIVGTFIQHQYIEPMLNKELIAQNASLENLTRLLNEQNDKLLIDLNACNAGIDSDESEAIALI